MAITACYRGPPWAVRSASSIQPPRCVLGGVERRPCAWRSRRLPRKPAPPPWRSGACRPPRNRRPEFPAFRLAEEAGIQDHPRPPFSPLCCVSGCPLGWGCVAGQPRVPRFPHGRCRDPEPPPPPIPSLWGVLGCWSSTPLPLYNFFYAPAVRLPAMRMPA